MSEYRIDDLARAAGTTVRNVRAYQDRGILPPPARRGRAAVYDDRHLERLRLIAGLLERGYSLAAIYDLTRAWDGGRSLGGILGAVCALAGEWTDEPPRHLDRAAFAQLFEADPDGPEAAVALDFGLVERDGDGFRVPSPDELAAGYELRALGMPLAAVVAELRAIRADTERIAARAVALAAEHVLARHADAMARGEVPAELADALTRLPRLVQAVVRSELARALRLQAPALAAASRGSEGPPG